MGHCDAEAGEGERLMYGTGTRSYNRSTEAREMKRQITEATKAYEEKRARGEIATINLLLCHCRSFRFGHEPSAHMSLKSDFDWRLPSERSGDQPEYWNEYR